MTLSKSTEIPSNTCEKFWTETQNLNSTQNEIIFLGLNATLLQELTHVILSSGLIINPINKQKRPKHLSQTWPVSTDTQKWRNYLSFISNSWCNQIQEVTGWKIIQMICISHLAIIANLVTATTKPLFSGLTVDKKSIRALEIFRVQKLILNATSWNESLASHDL